MMRRFSGKDTVHELIHRPVGNNLVKDDVTVQGMPK